MFSSKKMIIREWVGEAHTHTHIAENVMAKKWHFEKIKTQTREAIGD